MKSALIVSLEGAWYNLHGDAWQVTPEPPVLSGPSFVITDFDSAPCGVMAVDAAPEFAASMIEKRVRSEGLVDGEAHVLSHRLINAGGSCRVLYTAVPVTSWNAMFAWLSRESSIGLVISIESVMLALARRHGAVMCRTGRQFRFLVSRPERLSYVTTTAFSDDPDDLDIALITLMDRAGQNWQSKDERMPVYWCDLLASESDDGSKLAAQFSQRMGVKVNFAPAQRFDTPSGPMRTAAKSMAGAISWRNAVNPWNERISAAADIFSKPVAAVIALAGLGMFALAAVWTSQATEIQGRADRIGQEAQAIIQRIAGQDVPPAQLLAVHAPTIAFLDGLTRAVNSPDPMAVLTHVRQAAEKRVRVMRIQFVSQDGSFRVDGVPLNGANAADALSGFLAALNGSGYRISAEDPGNQSQLPGFFSYSLRKPLESNGVKR